MLIIKAEFLVLLIYLHVRLSTCDVHIFVSPHGSDQNDGHSDKVPVKSVQQALSLAGQTKYENATVYLELMPGYHDQDRTLVITRNNTVIRSYRRQQVHLTGGLRIPSSNIKPVTDHAILSRLPVNARSHVQVVNLHDLNITNFGIMDEYGSYRHRNSPLEVFYNGQPLQLARWPDDGYLDIVAVPDGKEGLRFRYNSTVPQSWHNENDPWAYGYWYYAWNDHALKLKSIDPATKTVTLVKKSPHGLRTGHLQEYLNGVSNIEGGYFRFINILSALDKPGEYYVDRDSGKLYMWVPNHDGSVKSSDKIYISMINDCIMIRSKTENVRLEDFTLEYCRRSGLYAPSVRKVKLTQLEIRNTGGSAANFAGDSRECEVSRCYIHDTCGGVWMYGGDRKTLQSSGNVIANNEITRYARVGAVGNEAITLIGVGVTAKNNHIYDGQYAAINFGGNDIIIENNLVHHVCKNVSTCGAIHTGSDWTYRGNAIQYNIVHHILNPFPGYTSKAVLLDSQASGTNVMYNALYDNTVHVMIGGGRYNNIANNVMYNAGLRSIEVDRRGISDQMVQRLHAMPYKSSVWSLRYPHLADIDNHNASLPEGNQIVKNVMYAAQNTEYIHGIPNFLRSNLSRYYNISQTGFSSGSGDHYNVSNRDLRVKCYVNGWANLVNFKQPPSPNAVGPLYSPTGPTYLKRGRLHLVSTKYPSVHCAQHPAQKVHPVPAYLPDGSRDMYHVEKKGCWVNVTKCKNHTASIGTYRDMYGERYHNATENVTMCFHRALEQWKLCGSHKDEFVVAIYGRTGAATLGGTGCMTALYGCPNHGGPADGHTNTTYGKYQHDYGKYSQDEKGCLANARNIWHWCGSSPNYPVTNIYLPTGAKRTAGAGCWITLDHCPAHTRIKTTFYDAIGSTNYQTDDSEFACINRAEYYWHYCGSNPKYPVTATFRPTTVSRTYPCDDVPSCLSY